MQIASKELTAAEAVEAWNNGHQVFSVNMGGLGPQYEMGIQRIAWAMLEEMLKSPFGFFDEEPEAKQKSYSAYIDAIEKTPAVNAILEEIGPTGAMFGAATNLASVITRKGYKEAMEDADSAGRLIIVSKHKV